MSTSPKIIPFRILLRLFPRAIALLGRVITARAPKRHRIEPAAGPAAAPAAPPTVERHPAVPGDGGVLSSKAFKAGADATRAVDASDSAFDAGVVVNG